jgi:hypothetical protein
MLGFATPISFEVGLGKGRLGAMLLSKKRRLTVKGRYPTTRDGTNTCRICYCKAREPVKRLPQVGSAKLIPVAVSLAGCSAVLGPLLDNYHSAFGVLAYADPWHPLPWLSTRPFVPVLFAGAGVAMGLLALRADVAWPPPARATRPGVPRTLCVIAGFAAVYYASAMLAAARTPYTGPTLAAASLGLWAAADGSVGAAAAGAAAAAAGWCVEAALVRWSGLYAYAHPDVAGLPLWIIPCYFAGGPALASLARTLAVWFDVDDKPADGR